MGISFDKTYLLHLAKELSGAIYSSTSHGDDLKSSIGIIEFSKRQINARGKKLIIQGGDMTNISPIMCRMLISL